VALAALLAVTGCARHPAATHAASSAAPAVAPAAPRAAAAPVTTAPSARTAAVPRRITGPRSVDVPAAAGAAPPRAAQRPLILGASVSPAVVRSGTLVRATVRTTAGVVSVVAHAGGVALDVPRVGPGLFAGSTTIPALPPFVRGSYPVTFVARDARGASTQSAVGVTVR
jgi:hypothetical protein